MADPITGVIIIDLPITIYEDSDILILNINSTLHQQDLFNEQKQQKPEPPVDNEEAEEEKPQKAPTKPIKKVGAGPAGIRSSSNVAANPKYCELNPNAPGCQHVKLGSSAGLDP